MEEKFTELRKTEKHWPFVWDAGSSNIFLTKSEFSQTISRKPKYFEFQVMLQKHNRNMSFSMYICALAVADIVTLIYGKFLLNCEQFYVGDEIGIIILPVNQT